MNETQTGRKHTLMLDNRRRLVLTGAVEVNGFNEETVSVKTTAGTLIIKVCTSTGLILKPATSQ